MSLFSHNCEAKVMTVFSIIKHRTARDGISRPGSLTSHHLTHNADVKSWVNFSGTIFNGMETTCGKNVQVSAELHKQAHAEHFEFVGLFFFYFRFLI